MMANSTPSEHRPAQFRLTGGLKLANDSPLISAAFDGGHCGSYSEAPNARWFCLRAKPRQEIDAWLQCQRQGFRAHLPLFVADTERVRPPHKAGTFKDLISGRLDTERDIIRPLFPGYLFVRFDPARDQWRCLTSTIGVAALFMSGAFTPTPVARGVVEKLIAKGRPGDGVIDRRYSGPTMRPDLGAENDIQPGQRVRITSGPFADLYGVCTMSWQRRNELLLSMFGSDRKVTVDRSNIEVA